MTTERDFDRIARAWLEFGPNEAPDRSIAAVLDAIETIPQTRQPWRWPFWRPTTMTRIPVLAAIAGLILVIVGMLALGSGRPAVSPTPSSAPSTSPAAVAPSADSQPLPGALVGGWVSKNKNFDAAPPNVISFGLKESPDLPVADFAFENTERAESLRSHVRELAPGTIELTTEATDSGCAKDAVGRYTWSVSTDGQWLALAPDGPDACAPRGNIIAGSWQRSLGHDSNGGPGIAAAFRPYVEFTLPREPWTAWWGTRENVAIDSKAGSKTFKIWKDLDGFADPCDITKGRSNLPPGMDAFIQYISTDPRFKVTATQDLTIDGHRAVALTFRIGDDLKAPCWTFDGNKDDRTGVLTWVQRSWPAEGFWNGTIASDGLLVVTEVDGTSIVFEAADSPASGPVVLQDVLDTVRFTNTLPTPPAS
jgi:hypothetical protein